MKKDKTEYSHQWETWGFM